MDIFDKKCIKVEKKHGDWPSKCMNTPPKLSSLHLNHPILFLKEAFGKC